MSKCSSAKLAFVIPSERSPAPASFRGLRARNLRGAKRFLAPALSEAEGSLARSVTNREASDFCGIAEIQHCRDSYRKRIAACSFCER